MNHALKYYTNYTKQIGLVCYVDAIAVVVEESELQLYQLQGGGEIARRNLPRLGNFLAFEASSLLPDFRPQNLFFDQISLWIH
jgi:hypothetical protein